jgi:hypothetical protein
VFIYLERIHELFFTAKSQFTLFGSSITALPLNLVDHLLLPSLKRIYVVSGLKIVTTLKKVPIESLVYTYEDITQIASRPFCPGNKPPINKS